MNVLCDSLVGLIVGLIGGGLIGWGIEHMYFKRQQAETPRLAEQIVNQWRARGLLLQERVPEARVVAEDIVHAVLTDAGVNENTPGVIKVTYIYEGQEYLSDLRKPGTDFRPIVENLVASIRIPITEVRVYKGKQLVHTQKVGAPGLSERQNLI